VQDTRFQSHYSLLKTIEAAFGLPMWGMRRTPPPTPWRHSLHRPIANRACLVVTQFEIMSG
jgi:hypothetical protein